MRDGNTPEVQERICQAIVVSLPMRDGTFEQIRATK